MRLRIFLLLFLAFFLADTIAIAQSGGRVDITPRRVILGPRDRSGEFTILNMSPQQQSLIRARLINYSMNEDGAYRKLEGPLNPVFDPEQIVRLSPRQFTLPPGGRQKVRFSIQRPADLPEGEYRFHILATRQSEYGPPAPVEAGERAVGVKPNIGVAIPVIVRHGNVTSGATLGDLAYTPSNKDGKPEISFTINRTGNGSTIGTATVLWLPAAGGGEQVGISSNLNVFPEIDKRNVRIALSKAPQGPGKFQVVYLNDETRTPYADATLQH